MPNQTRKPKISVIAALGRKNRAIGNNDQLLWKIPADLKRFKEITRGHPVIMGRKTFQSIVSQLKKPLPDRTNIVISRQTYYQPDGVKTATSLDQALKLATGINNQEIFIIGGQQVYEQVLPLADRLYLTLVDSDLNGDSHFPAYEKNFTTEVKREFGSDNKLTFSWVILEK